MRERVVLLAEHIVLRCGAWDAPGSVAHRGRGEPECLAAARRVPGGVRCRAEPIACAGGFACADGFA